MIRFFCLVLFLIVGLVFCLPATETNIYGETARPMRNTIQEAVDHPQSRGMLPPFYTEGKIDYINSSIVTQIAMEHPQTQHYIRHYTNNRGPMEYLSQVMARGGPYQTFIRNEIVRLGLPLELIYLPAIESSYVATALSRSGASGLWQFMTNSMEPFDMKVTEWMDERRDFWKATQGGLRKLKENYDFFGDWYLALAAYNAGLGGVNRMLQQSGAQCYWTLRESGILATETANYIPRMVAVSYILSNQRRYGIEASWPTNPNWQRIAVDRTVDIRILAEHAGLPRDELVWANRELLYFITPPEGSYMLKVSAENVERVTAVLERRDIPLVQHYIHRIRSGDTLFALALHFGVTVDQILDHNPGIEARFLRLDHNIVIPALRDVGPFVRANPLSIALDFSGTHLVKSGETLWSIAFAYEIDPELLAEANNMNISDVLREGRVLRTPIR